MESKWGEEVREWERRLKEMDLAWREKLSEVEQAWGKRMRVQCCCLVSILAENSSCSLHNESLQRLK